jgi:hypothetical protein
LLRSFIFAALLTVAGVLGPALKAQDSGNLQFKLATDPALRFGQVATQGYLTIYASGTISEGDTDRFIAFVRNSELDIGQVMFDSPGGSLLEGVKLGRAIRALGFTTAIGVEHDLGSAAPSAICASACAYAFAGGVLRYLSENDRLGLHQFRSVTAQGVSERDAQLVSGLLVAYLTEMGVDANAFAVASVSEPNSIIWLTTDEAKVLNFAFDGVGETTAQIRLADMRPFLRLDQQKPGVELRVLILCWQRKLSIQAGIVTDPTQTQDLSDEEWLKRSYLELDGNELLQVPGVEGAYGQDSVVWLARELTARDASAFLRADGLGIWLDGFGSIRAGGTMDLRPVRDAMRNYFQQCYAS